jgi:hypothetical protein
MSGGRVAVAAQPHPGKGHANGRAELLDSPCPEGPGLASTSPHDRRLSPLPVRPWGPGCSSTSPARSGKALAAPAVLSGGLTPIWLSAIERSFGKDCEWSGRSKIMWAPSRRILLAMVPARLKGGFIHRGRSQSHPFSRAKWPGSPQKRSRLAFLSAAKASKQGGGHLRWMRHTSNHFGVIW